MDALKQKLTEKSDNYLTVYVKINAIGEKFMREEKFLRINLNEYTHRKPKKILNLANILTRAGIKVIVKPICGGKVYHLDLDSATIYTIWQIPENYLAFPSKIENNQKILSPELYLIIVLRRIYNPFYFSDLEENVELCKNLLKTVELPKAVKSKSSIDDYFFPFKNEVFIGRVALEHHGIKDQLQSAPFEILSENIVGTIKTLQKQFGSTTLIEKFETIGDFALTRAVVKVKKKIIYFIYNAPEYELLPILEIKKSKVRIATLPVVARFCLIGTAKFVAEPFVSSAKNLPLVSERECEIFGRENLNAFGAIIENPKFLKDSESLLSITPSENILEKLIKSYYGRFVDDRVFYEKECKAETLYKPYENLIAKKNLMWY